MASTWTLITKTTHVYDASLQAPCCVDGASGIVHLVGVQRTVQKNDNVKSEANTWLVKNLQYVLSTFDSTFSCSSVPLLASTVGWLLCFSFLESPAIGCIQHLIVYGLGSANTYVVKGQLCCLPYHLSSRKTSLCNARIRYPALPQARERKLTFRAWSQIDIPKCDRQVHTHVHCENRSLIQSLILMCLAIK